MEVWEEIPVNAESGAKRLVDEYGKRLYAAACVLCIDKAAAEDLVFRTLAQTAPIAPRPLIRLSAFDPFPRS